VLFFANRPRGPILPSFFFFFFSFLVTTTPGLNEERAEWIATNAGKQTALCHLLMPSGRERKLELGGVALLGGLTRRWANSTGF